MNQQAIDQIKSERDAALRDCEGWKTEHFLLFAKVEQIEDERDALAAENKVLRDALSDLVDTCDWYAEDGYNAMQKAMSVLKDGNK